MLTPPPQTSPPAVSATGVALTLPRPYPYPFARAPCAARVRRERSRTNDRVEPVPLRTIRRRGRSPVTRVGVVRQHSRLHLHWPTTATATVFHSIYSSCGVWLDIAKLNSCHRCNIMRIAGKCLAPPPRATGAGRTSIFRRSRMEEGSLRTGHCQMPGTTVRSLASKGKGRLEYSWDNFFPHRQGKMQTCPF